MANLIRLLDSYFINYCTTKQKMDVKGSDYFRFTLITKLNQFLCTRTVLGHLQ